MSQSKYLRLKSENISEFTWQKTNDDKIIVRFKEDGEIILVIDKPLSQKELISDAYNNGLKTGLYLQNNYISFLEALTGPLMPDYEPTIEEYKPLDYDHAKLINLGEGDNEQSTHYLYEIYIQPKTQILINKIIKKYEINHSETFYSESCKFWIENPQTKLEIEPYAAPSKGKICHIFLNIKQRESFIWLSESTGYNIKDYLYTAIKEQALALSQEPTTKLKTTIPISRLIKNIRT